MTYNASGVTCQLGNFCLTCMTHAHLSAFKYSKYNYSWQWEWKWEERCWKNWEWE